MNDLFGSLYSGRLAGHQLIGLLDNYDIVYLVVEGNWRPNMHSGLVELADSQWHWHTLGRGKSAYTYRELVGRWNTLAVACGVIIAYTRDPQDTAAWIRFTYNWWQKDFSEHKSHRGFNRVNNLDRKVHFIKPTILRRMLKELPEVGWDLTEALEAAYPTMELLVAATETDLRSIPGVGKVIAHTIYRLLHEGG
jgi:ERCC4-type nuclease